MSETKEKPFASPHVMFKSLLGATGAHAIPALGAGEDAVFARLDGVGRQEIAEQIAVGRLPNEVALYYGLPVMQFRKWFFSRFSEVDIDEMKVAAAESLQVKAMLTLSANLGSPAAASQAKALSERMARIAESLSPSDWSPAHLTGDSRVPTVNITFGSTGGPDVTVSAHMAPIDSDPHPVIEGSHVTASPQQPEEQPTLTSGDPLTPASAGQNEGPFPFPVDMMRVAMPSHNRSADEGMHER